MFSIVNNFEKYKFFIDIIIVPFLLIIKHEFSVEVDDSWKFKSFLLQVSFLSEYLWFHTAHGDYHKKVLTGW